MARFSAEMPPAIIKGDPICAKPRNVLQKPGAWPPVRVLPAAPLARSAMSSNPQPPFQDLARDSVTWSADALWRAAEVGGIGFWRWEPSIDCVSLSPQSAALLGTKDVAALDYAGFLRLIDPDDRAAAAAALKASAASVESFAFGFRAGAHPENWISARGRAVSGAGSPVEVVGVLVCVGRRNADEEAMSRLAAIVTSRTTRSSARRSTASSRTGTAAPKRCSATPPRR